MNSVYKLVHVNIKWMCFQGYYRNVSWIAGIMLNEANKLIE
jgi:hypothetical protein